MNMQVESPTMKEEFTNILCRTLRTLFLTVHFFVTAELFYEIIFTIDDENYEILFNKIQYGLTATVSLISLSLYVWHCSGIQFTLLKLRKIDYLMKSIGIKALNTDCSPRPIEICFYLTLLVSYFYTRYLRNYYLNLQESLIEILKTSLIRTYFIGVNGFVTISFMKNVQVGQCRFKILNQHINSQVRIK